MQLDASGRQRQLSDITGPDIRTLKSGLACAPRFDESGLGPRIPRIRLGVS